MRKAATPRRSGSLRGTPLGALAAALLAAWSTPAVGFAETRYIAFGDSITEGIDHDDDCLCQCPELCGYPRRLEVRLGQLGFDATVENHGLGGEKTPEGLTRIDEVLEGGGDVLLLMEGTNDISRSISPETTIFNLGEMARKAAEKGLETLHATPIPRFPQAREDPENIVNDRLAQSIRELAFDNGRQLADPFTVFMAIPNVFDNLYGMVPTDGVGHPNSAGYDRLMRVFLNVIRNRDRVPPVLGFVEPANGSEDLSPFSRVRLRLYDFGAGIDVAATRLMIDGADVSFDATGDASRLELEYSPSAPLSDSVSVWLQSQDLENPPNVVDREATRFTVSAEVPAACQPAAATLCLDHRPGDRRFEVEMDWFTALDGGASGEALVTPLEELGLPAGGILSFFEGNPEVLIKVLDGCGLNEHFWIFGAAATTLGFEITVTDTLARKRGAPESEYRYTIQNADGDFAAPFFDILAFETCEFNE